MSLYIYYNKRKKVYFSTYVKKYISLYLCSFSMQHFMLYSIYQTITDNPESYEKCTNIYTEYLDITLQMRLTSSDSNIHT